MKSHLSLIICHQASLTVYTSFWDLIILRGAMMGFSERLNILNTFNDICFPILPSQIFILPKPLFPIMGEAPPYPNFSTDKIFGNPRQSTRGWSILSPLYLSKYLYPFSCRPKCPQHFRTQHVCLPVQVPEFLVSPKSTQGGISIW